MCGICAVIGYNENAVNHLIDGISMMLNRGSDSSGICSLTNDGKELIVTKYANELNKDAIDMLKQEKGKHDKHTICIGHNRWATHGAKTSVNAHPHLDHKNNIALVHNGIIDNFIELKEELMNNKISFKSQTDTEVIVNLISYYYDVYNNMELAIQHATNRLSGTWALVIMSNYTPDKLYCVRKGSPLLLGFGDGFIMAASEQAGFYKYVNNYICLNNNDIITIKKEEQDGNKRVYIENKKHYEIKQVTTKEIQITPSPYPYWLIREIMEQGDSSLKAINMGSRLLNDYDVRLGGLNNVKDKLLELNHIILLGCGTSLNAGIYLNHVFKDLCDFITVTVFDGAEFSVNDIPRSGKTGLILLSQSGETRDLHKCIQIANDNNLLMIGVINVVDSLIAREVHCGVYLNAGREVSVASTKSFVSQIIVGSLIAIWFAQHKKLNPMKRKQYIASLRQLSVDINMILTNKDIRKKCKEMADILCKHYGCFLLGKGINEAIAREGSLKLKEVGYIHAEAQNTSGLKHGSYALITDNYPIVFIAPKDQYISKNINVIDEVLSRNAYPIVITDDSHMFKNRVCNIIEVPENDIFKGIMAVIPLQLITYEMSLIKGHNPDFPRHLAKCVTVD